jgi:hypothetical protein
VRDRLSFFGVYDLHSKVERQALKIKRLKRKMIDSTEGENKESMEHGTLIIQMQ